jgi:Caspase domain
MGRLGQTARRLVLLVALLAWTCVAQARADDGRRIALIIGNTAYAHSAILTNPRNDAQAVAAALRRIGFAMVEVHQDLGRTAFLQVLQAFAREARTAELALVFYAGHGLELLGRNFLIPTDARLATDNDVEFEAVPLDLVLHTVEGSKQLRLVLLDACRDNPFVSKMAIASGGGRSIGRGLARVEPPRDTLVAYAAKDGQVAEDGLGANSPYTTALLQHLETPGLEIQYLFRKVRDAVLAATGNKQEPYVYGSLGGEPYYLVPQKLAPGANQNMEIELAFWRALEQSRDADGFEEYLRQFPNGTFAFLARKRLRDLRALTSPPEAPTNGPAGQQAPPISPPFPPTKSKDIADREARPSQGSASRSGSPRCTTILARSQLGEPLSDSDLTYLQRNCGS